MRGISTILLAATLLAATTLAAPTLAWAQEKKEDDKQQERRRRGPPGGGWGNPADFTKRAVDFLDNELDLTDTQKKEIEKIFSDSMDDMMLKVGEAFSSGDMEKGRKLIEDLRVNISKKISKVLTPAQRKGYEVLVENFDRRAQEFENSRRVSQDISQLFNPKPPSRRILMSKAERLLFLSAEETAVLLPYVAAVVDKRQALYEGRLVRRKDLLNASKAGASKKEILERVGEIRAAEAFQRLELAASMERLRSLLTIEQEVRFVAAGIIE